MSMVNDSKLLRRLELKVEFLLQRSVMKDHYTTEEFAIAVNRAPFTVRQWCNSGRIHAKRSGTRAGSTRRWTISHGEYLRFQREGLLPLEITNDD